jgi:phage terminase large subunit-like protein
MSEGPYYYDASLADRAVDFFPRFLRHVKGEWAGKPLELSPADAHDVRQLFGWRRRADGRRRYRRFFDWKARKNAKTIKAAGLGHLLTVGDGEPGAETYSHAVDKAQAAISYDMGAAMVAMSPELSDLYEVTKTGMFCPHTMSTWRPLSGTPTGKHGLNAHCLLGDEVHEWTNDRLHTFLRQSMGARRQPLDILISTAGLREGYGYDLYMEAKRIRDGVTDDPETYVVIHEADEKDDWTDPATWAKANPNLGITISQEYLAKQCRDAQQNPRLENDFKRYHLNMWVSQAVRWLPMDEWRKCSAAPADPLHWKKLEEKLRGRRCFGGLDLASTQDICALALIFPAEDGMPLAVLMRFWAPADMVAQRTRVNRLPYDRWVREGAMVATPGNVTDYGFIREQIIADCERFKLEKLGVDPYNATHLTQELIAEGVPVELVRQRYLNLSPPSKELERLVMSHALEHGNHPVLDWMAGNVGILTDSTGNIMPAKEAKEEKIDGISAIVTGMALTMAAPIAVDVGAAIDQGVAIL